LEELKHYIFVAGYDYLRSGVNFINFCKSRMRKIYSSESKKEELVFFICDFTSGKISKHTVEFQNGRPFIKESPHKQFDAISLSKNYNIYSGSPYRFYKGKTNTMSIIDIYELIAKIGEENSKTLLELSFFSHGYQKGPILANSYDERTYTDPITNEEFQYLENERNKDDIDPRISLDMDYLKAYEIDIYNNIGSAFSDNGIMWTWGCAFSKDLNFIFSKFLSNSVYKDSGLIDDDIFVFKAYTFSEKNLQLFNNSLSIFSDSIVESNMQKFERDKEIKIKFKEFKTYCCAISRGTFAYSWARIFSIKTYGALVGTYSEYSKVGEENYMRVTPKLSATVRFYKNYIGFSTDIEGGMYAEYKNKLDCEP